MEDLEITPGPFNSFDFWKGRATKAEAEAERHGAEVHRRVRENTGLKADVRDYRESLKAARTVAQGHVRAVEVLQSQLKECRCNDPATTQGMAVAAEEDEDLPDLPAAYSEAALKALEAFAEGYAEYGPGAADALGLAGQWGDLHRKVMKLKRPFWNGEVAALTRESSRDILRDIIGHCLLALVMLDEGFEGGRS